MSVNLMSAIFETEFFDIKDEDGNVTKASTAKLVLLAMADHANDEGEGSYPSVERLCRKTALSEQTIRNTFDALRYNGVIELAGRSKYGTNNHTINTKSFPKAIGKEVTSLTLYPLGGSNEYLKGSNESLLATLPIRPESLLNKQETSTEIISTAKQEPDKVLEWLKMGQFAGAKRETRIDAILSYLGERFHVNTEVKKWKDFAKFVETRQTHHGESVEVFVSWLLGQKDFNLQYWPPSKMQEFWPMAFVKDDKAPQNAITTEGGFYVT